MNEINLKGYIKDIKPAYNINGVEFSQANLLVLRKNGKEDLINVRFKSYSNFNREGDLVNLSGNLRSYSHKMQDGHNKVDIYVNTYFDEPEEGVLDNTSNSVKIDGRICKKNDLIITPQGKEKLLLIVANNIILPENNLKINSYIPCVAWGKVAKALNNYNVNDKLLLNGELHSREYKKKLDNKDEFEIRITHELLIKSFEVLNDD